ncbi:hypothetical protein [Nonomuraea soli]|uniref:Serine/threonine protein kinase n=1 Tax=Nonomuraea soli TaxID=1032476 RepID=A0A7W0CR70_9ACTN|nr:hypothetical protein [Nonomuraea soli]MBA2895836.1 hypothetical protein [Nonomuraea soli]
MSKLGPFLTLAAGAVLAAGLGVASVTAQSAESPATAANVAEPGATAEATSVATPSGKPEASKPARAVRADYAGRVEGTRALVAVSVRDAKAIGYFCDGKTEAWFVGKVAEGQVSLEGFGGATLSATLGGGKAVGEVALGGKKWDFTAPTAKKPSGLYRASAIVRGARIKAGWIYLRNPNGDGFVQVGTAFVGDQQVETPQLTPGQPVTIDGEQLEPKDVDGFIEEMQ